MCGNVNQKSINTLKFHKYEMRLDEPGFGKVSGLLRNIKLNYIHGTRMAPELGDLKSCSLINSCLSCIFYLQTLWVLFTCKGGNSISAETMSPTTHTFFPLKSFCSLKEKLSPKQKQGGLRNYSGCFPSYVLTSYARIENSGFLCLTSFIIENVFPFNLPC